MKQIPDAGIEKPRDIKILYREKGNDLHVELIMSSFEYIVENDGREFTSADIDFDFAGIREQPNSLIQRMSEGYTGFLLHDLSTLHLMQIIEFLSENPDLARTTIIIMTNTFVEDILLLYRKLEEMGATLLKKPFSESYAFAIAIDNDNPKQFKRF